MSSANLPEVMRPGMILIIEDESTMLKVLQDNFEFSRWTVITASDGKEGLQAALDEKPDLILLDIMMPEMNGYRFEIAS